MLKDPLFTGFLWINSKNPRVPDSLSAGLPDFGKDAQDLSVFNNETTRLDVLHARRTPKISGRIWDPEKPKPNLQDVVVTISIANFHTPFNLITIKVKSFYYEHLLLITWMKSIRNLTMKSYEQFDFCSLSTETLFNSIRICNINCKESSLTCWP